MGGAGMLQNTLKVEIIQHLDGLTLEQLEKVLNLVQSMTTHMAAGVPGHQLLKYVGCISSADLALMAEAIEETCEQIHPEE
jgi:hypothetical protein